MFFLPRPMIGLRWALALSIAALGGAAAAQQPSDPAVKQGVDRWQAGDYAAAVAAWRGPAARGDADAQFNLGQAYKLGRGVDADMVQALAWYRKAAAQGHLQAQDLLGLTLFVMGRRDEAMPFVRDSAARGEPRAQFLLGTAHFNGDYAEKDWVRAYALMTRAQAAGVPNAGQSLATMDKFVGPADRQKAVELADRMERDAQVARTAALTGAATAGKPASSASVTAGTAVRPKPPATAAATAPGLASAPARPADLPASAPVRPVDLPASQAHRDPAAIPGYTPSVPARSAATVAQPVAAPSPAPVAPRPSAAPTGGSYRIQVAAVGSIDGARSYWNRLETKEAGLKAFQPYLVEVGSIVRVQAGDFGSSAEAEKACTLARRAGSGCFVTRR